MYCILGLSTDNIVNCVNSVKKCMIELIELTLFHNKHMILTYKLSKYISKNYTHTPILGTIVNFLKALIQR